MEAKFYRACNVDKKTARLYIEYLKEHEYDYEASDDEPLVYISIFETEKRIKAFKKWILKQLY